MNLNANHRAGSESANDGPPQGSNSRRNQGCEERSCPNGDPELTRLGNAVMNLVDKQDLSEPCMPWFGLDIGGTLVKVVFFDPNETRADEEKILNRARLYLKSSKAYGTTGKRDEHLEMANCVINKREGTLHFIRFATDQMPEFIKMAKDKGLAEHIDDVCATGGGAYKFEMEIRGRLGIRLRKSDELDSIIYGIHHIDKYNPSECYYLREPLVSSGLHKVPYDFSQPYPYLVVNIGSGVSFLAVHSATSYSRVWGSPNGGGFFEGLCSFLTPSLRNFDDLITMAEAGQSTLVNKSVGDIFGPGGYPKFNLEADVVASSFGNMTNPDKRDQVKSEDLVRAKLESVTLNIAALAMLNAAVHKIDRVVFIGSFLRRNELSMRLLSHALDYQSKNFIEKFLDPDREMKALFLEHEGYFGAVGCLVESTQGLVD